MTQRRPRTEDKAHREFIGGLPCLICGNNIESQCAHVSYSDLRWGKPNTKGIANKVSDFYCIPLCGRHHTDQHAMNEREFWQLTGIDPVPIAMALWIHSGDQEAGEMIVSAWRPSLAA